MAAPARAFISQKSAATNRPHITLHHGDRGGTPRSRSRPCRGGGCPGSSSRGRHRSVRSEAVDVRFHRPARLRDHHQPVQTGGAQGTARGGFDFVCVSVCAAVSIYLYHWGFGGKSSLPRNEPKRVKGSHLYIQFHISSIIHSFLNEQNSTILACLLSFPGVWIRTMMMMMVMMYIK